MRTAGEHARDASQLQLHSSATTRSLTKRWNSGISVKPSPILPSVKHLCIIPIHVEAATCAIDAAPLAVHRFDVLGHHNALSSGWWFW